MTKKSGVSDGSQLSRRGARRPLSTGKRCACENGLNTDRSDAGGGGEGWQAPLRPRPSTSLPPLTRNKCQRFRRRLARSGIQRRKEWVGLRSRLGEELRVIRLRRGPHAPECLSGEHCSAGRFQARSLCNISLLVGEYKWAERKRADGRRIEESEESDEEGFCRDWLLGSISN